MYSMRMHEGIHVAQLITVSQSLLWCKPEGLVNKKTWGGPEASQCCAVCKDHMALVKATMVTLSKPYACML